jgi:transcriptional regulator with XRE-family HTH domain
MAMHIGEEMRVRVKARGMSVVTFASRIGRSPQNVHKLFKQQSVDTQILRKASEALDYNFFHLLASDLDEKLKPNNVQEPAAQYVRRPPTVIIVSGDDMDQELLDRITKATKATKR